MSAQIKVYNSNLKALGSTSKAFNIDKTEELMREYTLSFSVVNNDSVFKHLAEDTVFKYGGQYFDVAGIDGDSGETNITQITAEHISYRLADYTLPNGYSFVGTVRQIAEDILNEAKTVDEIPASSVFSIGTVADLGTVSFGMSGKTNVTAREALVAMSYLGVEITFDNFTVNLPERTGADNGVSFEYGINLNGVHRTWQRGNGWSYDVRIVDLQKIVGNEHLIFGLGDNIVVRDTQSNITLDNRIISYTECDDPTQNHITIGVFVRDNASLAIETDRVANSALNSAASANETADAAKEKADNSVQQGEKYSNVSITHKDGFMAVNKSGTQRVMMNADDCFVVQALQNGKWVTVNSLELFGLLVDRLTSLEAKDKFYIKVGKTDSDKYGLLFYIDDQKGFEVSSSDADTIALKSPKAIYLESGDLFKLEATDTICLKALANDAISYIEARNLALYTDNLISKNSTKGLFGRGISGSCKLETTIDGTSTTGDFEIINGIITKFPGLQFTW